MRLCSFSASAPPQVVGLQRSLHAHGSAMRDLQRGFETQQATIADVQDRLQDAVRPTRPKLQWDSTDGSAKAS